MSSLQKQIAIVSEFEQLSSWEERYQHLIRIGRDLKTLPDDLRTDDAKVRGCSSNVWLHAQMNENGRVALQADSDALIVSGLVVLLLRVYNDETPSNILSTEPMFIEELGLEQHLSASRANGLLSMVKQIKTYALAFQQQAS